MKTRLLAALLLSAPIALSAAPPPPPPANIAKQGSFAVEQIATLDAAALKKNWGKPGPAARDGLTTSTSRNQPLHTFLALSGCKADAAGECNVVANFLILDPAGKRYTDADGISIYRGPPSAAGQSVLSWASLGLHVKPGEAMGAYTAKVEVIDKNAGITLRTQQVLTVAEVPVAGGWNPVPNPNTAAELKGPLQAMLAEISTAPLKVAQVISADKQVVEGTNYRMRVRMTNGKTWQAVVWKKLDGTYKVSEIAQVAM